MGSYGLKAMVGVGGWAVNVLRRLLILALVVVAVVGGKLAWDHLHHHGPTASQVASLAGAYSCTDSGYWLKDELDGSKTTIWSCSLPRGTRCVSVEGGIAHDITAETKLAFEGTLSSGRPSCIG